MYFKCDSCLARPSSLPDVFRIIEKQSETIAALTDKVNLLVSVVLELQSTAETNKNSDDVTSDDESSIDVEELNDLLKDSVDDRRVSSFWKRNLATSNVSTVSETPNAVSISVNQEESTPDAPPIADTPNHCHPTQANPRPRAKPSHPRTKSSHATRRNRPDDNRGTRETKDSRHYVSQKNNRLRGRQHQFRERKRRRSFVDDNSRNQRNYTYHHYQSHARSHDIPPLVIDNRVPNTHNIPPLVIDNRAPNAQSFQTHRQFQIPYQYQMGTWMPPIYWN